MPSIKSKNYLPKRYFKVQCITDDKVVRDLLKSDYVCLGEGESSVVLAVSTKGDKHAKFARDIMEYRFQPIYLEEVPVLEKKPIIPKIIDTVDLGIKNIEDLNKIKLN